MKKLAVLLALTISMAAVGCGGKSGKTEAPAEQATETIADNEAEVATAAAANPEGTGASGDGYAPFAAIVEKYYQAAMEEWDMNRLTEEGMSSVLAYSYMSGSADIVGYANYDLNSDGTDELLIGTITGDEYSDLMILDAYALDNGSAKQLFVGGERDRYYMVYDEAGSIVIANEGSNSASNSGYFYLIYDGTGMTPVQGLIYDDSVDPENPWRSVYEYTWDMEKGEAISGEDANAIVESYTNNYIPMDYIPVPTGYNR